MSINNIILCCVLTNRNKVMSRCRPITARHLLLLALLLVCGANIRMSASWSWHISICAALTLCHTIFRTIPASHENSITSEFSVICGFLHTYLFIKKDRYNIQQIQMYYRSGTAQCRWALHVHLPDGSTFCIKWCRGRHLESVTSNWKSDSCSWYVFTWRTFLPNFIPVLFEMMEP